MPSVGDSKRAMDEYVSEIFMGGYNTISMHNTCEGIVNWFTLVALSYPLDSLLASPLIIDLLVLAELFERITYKTGNDTEWNKFHPV